MKDKPKVLLLCGFSGSGKTRTGEILAEKIGYSFVDTDKVVEDHFDKTIPEIFVQLGEGKFRFAESDVIRMASKQENVVIALGGGSMADKYATAYLKCCGHLIYLRATADTIYDRLRDSDLRPMLKTMAGGGTGDQKEAVMERIESLLKEREPYYLEADTTIDTEGKSPEDVAEAIKDMISGDAG